MPTSALREKILANPKLLDQVTASMSVFAGAIPIMVGDQVIGAIGASGGTSNQEEACAKTGLDKIKSRLQ